MATAAIVAEKNAALTAARAERDRMDARIAAEIKAASEAIQDKYRTETDALDRIVMKAACEAEVAIIAAAKAHPLVGKKVETVRNKKVGGSKWKPRFADVTIYGIVEACDYSSQFSRLTSRRNDPEIGEVFIRLLLADGTPGLSFEALTDRWTETKDAA